MLMYKKRKARDAVNPGKLFSHGHVPRYITFFQSIYPMRHDSDAMLNFWQTL